jgi:Cu(I)/Ag(I) efflux system membrane fusion protein
MKKTSLIALAIVVVIAGLLVSLSRTGIGRKGSKDNATVASTPAPSQVSAEAGKEGPKTGGAQPQGQEEAPTIEIPPEKQQMIGVKTVSVSVRPLEKIIRTVGKV